jgi:hypothetical protein
VKKVFCFILILFSVISLSAQEGERRFFIRPHLGIQGAQIDGDYYAGYNQAGFVAGAFTGRNVSENTALSFALLFSQKGARRNANPQKGDFDYYRSRLNYIEVPFHITRHFKKVDLYGGLYYARLISSKEENQNGIIVSDNKYKPNDIGYLLGGEGQIRPNFYFGVRFAYSLIPIRDYFFNGAIYYYNFMQRLFNKGLYNNTLTFYFQYNFNPGKKSEQ